jgi:hypothetical protein
LFIVSIATFFNKFGAITTVACDTIPNWVISNNVFRREWFEPAIIGKNAKMLLTFIHTVVVWVQQRKHILWANQTAYSAENRNYKCHKRLFQRQSPARVL